MASEENEPKTTGGSRLKANLLAGETWLRGLYMVLFVIFFWVTKFVVWAVVVFQFGSVLITRKTNARVLEFGVSLSAYVREILLFLTYNTEEKPFPFGPWPESAAGAPRAQPARKPAKKPAKKKSK